MRPAVLGTGEQGMGQRPWERMNLTISTAVDCAHWCFDIAMETGPLLVIDVYYL